MLIHSSEHPTIDYTALEGTEPNEAHTKHYIAVYDPATNKLKVTEATSLTVRPAIRQRPKLEESDDEDTQNFLALQGTRSALTEAFGSKKSKKAVQSMAENRQLGQGGEGATITNAITAHMADDEDEEEPEEEEEEQSDDDEEDDRENADERREGEGVRSNGDRTAIEANGTTAHSGGGEEARADMFPRIGRPLADQGVANLTYMFRYAGEGPVELIGGTPEPEDCL